METLQDKMYMGTRTEIVLDLPPNTPHYLGLNSFLIFSIEDKLVSC